MSWRVLQYDAHELDADEISEAHNHIDYGHNVLCFEDVSGDKDMLVGFIYRSKDSADGKWFYKHCLNVATDDFKLLKAIAKHLKTLNNGEIS